MSDRHVIVGAGPVGTETAKVLSARGSEVLMLSRSGRGPELAGVSRRAVDATDPAALAAATEGATALYNCANPGDYTQWEQTWPPLAASLLAAAERTGAVLVTAGSLYPYGPVDVPMTEDLPAAATDHKGQLRARMTADAFHLPRAGRIRAVEVRGSDYVGVGVGKNGHLTRTLPRAAAGKGVRVMGSPDLPHSWTDVQDMGRTLVAAADRPESWGQVWHAPTNAPKTQRQAMTDVLATVGKPAVAVRPMPLGLLKVVAAVHPLTRELLEMSYQFRRPYVLDSSAAQREFGLAPTPWDEVCRRTATAAA
jgi:nucleoside-diphosphate-sugar epimerase